MVAGRYRRFTPREAANIQSFPELFKLDVVSENRQYRAIGNAVPPVLMWHVANALVKCCSVETPKEVKETKEIINQEVLI
jgi:DNA (cytosine-5)-methyltransferase 1